MADETENTSPAQEPQAPDASNTESKSPDYSGVEKRIAELVAQGHAQSAKFQADLDHERSVNAELIRTLAQGVTKEVVPQVEIDPEQRKVMDAYFTPQMRSMQAQLQQLVDQTRVSQVRQAAAGVDPAVAARAEQLFAEWNRRGLNGWTPADAITFAEGELARKASAGATQARNERGQFNAMGQGIAATSAPAPVQRQARPGNFDSMSLEQQIAIYEKDIGDKPF